MPLKIKQPDGKWFECDESSAKQYYADRITFNQTDNPNMVIAYTGIVGGVATTYRHHHTHNDPQIVEDDTPFVSETQMP